jgi:monofunctional biosynthetic peptidoglycan transglycosylase
MRFRRKSKRRRAASALGLAVLLLVLVPVLVVVDSYRIVLDVRPLARETPDRTRVMEERLADPRTPRPLRQRRVEFDAISPYLVHGVIVHEDATFYEHHGFDRFEIRDALRRSFVKRRLVRGASTITTQLARNLYLGTDRSLFRKLREIPLTVRLEGGLTKRRILELYLNLVEWGPGVFGAEAASLYHFGVSAKDLTPVQAALLAAALPSPRRSTPAHPSAYLRRRAAIILVRMEARGWLALEALEAGRRALGAGAEVGAAEAAGGLAEPPGEPGDEAEPESEPEPEPGAGPGAGPAGPGASAGPDSTGALPTAAPAGPDTGAAGPGDPGLQPGPPPGSPPGG